MKTNFKKQALAAAVAAGLGLAASGSAYAEVYAVATQDITNFSLTGGSSTITILSGNLTSTAGATLLGTTAVTGNPKINVIGTGLPDADLAWVTNPSGQTSPGNNSKSLVGRSVAYEYARGDAVISNGDILNGNGAAWNIAEALLLSSSGTGQANGNNRLGAQFTINVGGTGTALTFSWGYNNDIGYFMGSPPPAQGLAGASITASYDVSINIYDSTGQTLIESISTSPYNRTFARVLGDPNVDPPSNPTGTFSGTTTSTFAGTYFVDISMNELVQISQTPIPTPEPATLLLLGGGLSGLAYVHRRRAKKA